MRGHPNYDTFNLLSLKELQGYDPRITDDLLAKIDVALGQTVAAPTTASTPIFLLMARADTAGVLNTFAPGMAEHPNYARFKYLSLKGLQAYDPRLSDDLLGRIQAALDALKP